MEAAVIKRVAVVILLCLPAWSWAQTAVPPLERLISVSFNGISSREALRAMETEGGYIFAYRTDLVSGSDYVSRTYLNKTTREILDDLFQTRLEYREKGNYIVLKAAPVLKPQEIRLEGYVVDKISLEKVPFASVYDSSSLYATVSDAYGHYALQTSVSQAMTLVVRKYGYYDTTYTWDAQASGIAQLEIRPVEREMPELDTLRKSRIMFFKLSEEQKANILNFKERLRNNFQFSLVPGLGTNGKLSSVTTVDYSFNLLGGFNGGVRKMEFAGLCNFDWDTVRYFQLAGFLNGVGGYQEGVQIAGFANLNNDAFKGFQMAGFYNVTRKDFYGVQLSGFAGFVHGHLSGVQGSGFMNFADSSSKAVQLAGFASISGKSMHGIQAAGGMNYAGEKSRGVQLAGFANYAGKDFEGLQVAGFINVASKIKGVQLGFINISDSIEGLPVGFLSFSRQGYHQLELSVNDVSDINLSFRTGTHRLYNIFSVVSDVNANPYKGFGYGLGTSFRTSEKSRIYLDLQAFSLYRKNFVSSNALLKLNPNFEYRFGKYFSLAGGPTINALYVYHATSPEGMEAMNVAPYTLADHTVNQGRLQFWVGGQLAIRFF